MERELSHHIFEFLVYLILAGALLVGVGRSDFVSDYLDDYNNITSSEEPLVGDARKVMLCTDNSPPHAIVQYETFIQVKINSSWYPAQTNCSWECGPGFVRVGDVCEDIDECNNITSSACRNVDGGYVISSTPNSIYSTYPATIDGREIMIPFLDEGDMVLANEIINNDYRISRRFESSSSTIFEEVSWDEDPYSDKYWRFLYYSLRPTRHLLYAWFQTEDDIYKDKLVEIINSFYEGGMDSEYTWDKHGSAFRTMVLINTWWKLRENNVLDEELSNRILQMLKEHGEFLENETNFETEHNHGINEAAALFLLGDTFPDLEKSQKWRKLGVDRLDLIVDKLIDDDGVLVENSPYYHFYSLRLFWNIYGYSIKHNVSISDHFDDKISKMINYSIFIVQPDLEVPTIGASLSSKVNNKNEYYSIALDNPQFLYMITQGEQGDPPEQKSVHFPESGQTIMRSGWGERIPYENETFLVFDVGGFRTKHSDLDALSFHLYSDSRVLMPDAGLFTYEKGRQRDYFHGTYSHNTVLVDNVDQYNGSVESISFFDGEFYTYQSAQHNLYEGVVHKRGVLLIEEDYVLVLDRLLSTTNHDYSQQFLFAPGINILQRGLVIEGVDQESNELFSIHQMKSSDFFIRKYKGLDAPYRGWCSQNYKEAIPCNQVSYTSRSHNVDFFTLIKIGDAQDISYNLKEDNGNIDIILNDGDKVFNVFINNFAQDNEKLKVVRGGLK